MIRKCLKRTPPTVDLTKSETDVDVESLKAEISRLKRELDDAVLRADAYNEMINVAEERFSIPTRKKAGARQ